MGLHLTGSSLTGLSNAFAASLTATAVKTGAYTAAAGDLIPVDATSGAVTVTLPTAPAARTRVAVKKIDTSSNIVTVTAGGSDVFNKAGGSTSLTLTLTNQAISLQYSGGIWYVVGDDLPLSGLSNVIAASGRTVPAWAPNTAYGLGQQVLNPSGQVVAAIAAFTSGATYNAANWQASSTVAARSKDVMGGQRLAPVRVPSLSVVETWPNPAAPFLRLMWTEGSGLTAGSTIYAYGRDRSIRKSTDYGRTWTRTGESKIGATSIQFGTIFWKTTAGSLLAFRFDYDQLYRSTDDGATWTSVHTLPFKQLLGPMSICQDLTTGYMYYAEYPTLTGLTSATAKLWRSTDDGVTWSAFYSFPTSGAGSVTHIHSIQWDHVAQRVIISTGDSTPDTGLYRINAAGTGVEPMILNSNLSAGDLDLPRSIGVIPTTDYIVWAADASSIPYVCRMHRSQIGLASPVVEKVYRLNSSAWWSCKASDDGSRWVVCASGENTGNRIDSVSHLYAIEDQGATVYEVGTIRSRIQDTVTLAPVGAPGNHGDVFFMQTHTDTEPGSWKFSIGLGSGIAIPWPQRIQVPVTKTVNIGPVSLAAGAEIVFAVDNVAFRAPTLHLFDAGAAGTVGGAKCIVRVNGVDQITVGNNSERNARDAEWGAAFITYACTGGQTVQIVIKNNGGSTITDATAFCTYGWGSGVGLV